jgi:hypothetical protein
MNLTVIEQLDKRKVIRILVDILEEFDNASENFPKMASPHEGYAIIKEELEELWHEIKNNKKKKSRERARLEGLQTAAMSLRLLYDHYY